MNWFINNRSNLLVAGIFIAVFGVYAFSPVTTSGDSGWTFHVAASILREGNIDLDEYRDLMDLDLDYRLITVGNHVYSYYPSAIPILSLPVVWAANKLFPLHYSMDFYTYLAENGPTPLTAKLEKLTASLISALCSGVMFLIARQALPLKMSVFLSIIFALGTSMWSTASRALWQHAPSVLLLTLALYLLLVSEEKKYLTPVIGIILALAYIIRPTNSISIAFISLFIFFNRREQFVTYSISLALVLILLVAHSWATYNSFLPPYSFQLFNRFGTIRGFFNALAGLVVSPNRGLLVFSPIFLFSFYGIYQRIKGRGFNAQTIDPYLAGILLTHWITTSTFEQWDGGWSLGPRYFTDMIPYLTYFLMPVFENQIQASLRAGGRVILASAILLSIFVHFRLATNPYPYWWSGKPQALVEAPERVWDWSDLQFLRGLCKDDPLEGKAPACWFGNYQ